MKRLLLLLPLLPLLSGCRLLYPHSEDDIAAQASNTSVAGSKKDGVFLHSYAVEPANGYLLVKEAFVEQQFMKGDKPGQIIRLDTSRANASLIIVLAEPPKLGVLHFDWNLLLADGVDPDDRQQLTYCDQPTPLLLRFSLKKWSRTSQLSLPLRLELMQGRAANVVKVISLQAKPL